MSTHAEVVVTGLMFPEGPVWCDDGTVVCTSVAEGALYRVWPQHHRAERIAVTGGGANAAAPVDDGGFLVTQNGGIDFRGLGLYAEAPPYRPAEAGLQRVAPDGTATYVAIGGFNAPNDLVVAPDGTVYFTDPPQHPPPPEPVGRVHALRPDGTTEVVASGFSYCNGIALEADATLVVSRAGDCCACSPTGRGSGSHPSSAPGAATACASTPTATSTSLPRPAMVCASSTPPGSRSSSSTSLRRSRGLP